MSTLSHRDWDRLVLMEEEALRLQRVSDYAEAARIWTEILAIAPDWEHGAAHHDLAFCCRRLGRLGLAERHYREALRIEPLSPIFLGSYVSFLYLHGDPARALEQYLRLVQLEAAIKNTREQVERMLAAIKNLAKRVGLAEAEAVARFEEAFARGSRGEFPAAQ